MIPNKEPLDGEDVRARMEAVLGAELGLSAVGCKCDGALVINVLVAAALQGGTLESVRQNLDVKVDSNTLWAYLNRHIEVRGLREQEVAVNRSLSACIPLELPRQKCEMALDFHTNPFTARMLNCTATPVGDALKTG